MKPYYDEAGITIYHGDCREVLPRLDGPFDALLTDPPFNVGKDYGASKDSLSDLKYHDLVASVIGYGPEPQAWVTPKKHWRLFGALLPDAQMVVVRRGAQGPIRFGWSDQYDLLLVRGTPTRAARNLWDDIRLRGEGYFFTEESFGHPGYTPKPLFDRLIDLLTEPGDTVLDPFAGTGTSLRAAKDLGRKAIGIELEERYCEIAVQRLAQEVLAL